VLAAPGGILGLVRDFWARRRRDAAMPAE
jgi:hypothetical protein